MPGCTLKADTVTRNADDITKDPSQPQAQTLSILRRGGTQVDPMTIRDTPVERNILGGKAVFET